MNKFKIVAPILYNTYKRPDNPNNYSVWIPLGEEKPQIYIDNKWLTFVATTQDELYEENCKEDKEISDLKFNIIKSLKDYVKENNKEYQQFFKGEKYENRN